MFRAIPVLKAALLATLVLPGCATPVTINAPRPLGLRPVAPAAAGAVKVSFPGIQPVQALYKTLATRQDIAAVGIFLTSGNQTQSRRLERADLWVPMVEVRFDKVAAGAFSFTVKAYDEFGNTIGHGIEKGEVKARETTTMNMRVQLDSSGTTGDVAAIIDFIDGDATVPVEPCATDAFFAADRDGNGLLSYKEWRAVQPSNDLPMVRPLPMILPAESDVTTDESSISHSLEAPEAADANTAAALPPLRKLDPLRIEFNRLDRNGDSFLDLSEFCHVVPDIVYESPIWRSPELPGVMPAPEAGI
jgi:hypothetical protein